MSILFYELVLMNFVNYDLNPDLIAQNPCSPRDACNLMTLDIGGQKIAHYKFFELSRILKKGDILVFNDTKVLKARLIGVIENEDGSTIKENCELFLVKCINNSTKWLALARPGRLFIPGYFFAAQNLRASIIDKHDDGSLTVNFLNKNFEDLIERVGQIPLPPYIRQSQASMEDYQTVFANRKGSVAAPTAGLHFTKKQLINLKTNGIDSEFVTLHVGRGTFETIKTADFRKHIMHSECARISESTAEKLNNFKRQGRRIIAVGTTSVRTLEAFANQNGQLEYGEKNVSLFICPPYKFKFVDAIITNFHLPKSTLLLMISAFAGSEFLKESYAVAMDRQYRFFSFGDAMFLYQ